MAKKLLGTLDICGIIYKIFEGSAADNEDLEGNHGICVHAKQEIWIKAGLDLTRSRDTLLHEILHAILDESGARESTAATFQRGEDLVGAWEESFIRIMTPHLVRIFGAPRLTKAPKT